MALRSGPVNVAGQNGRHVFGPGNNVLKDRIEQPQPVQRMIRANHRPMKQNDRWDIRSQRFAEHVVLVGPKIAVQQAVENYKLISA